MLDKKWSEIEKTLDFAFQPIIHTNSGKLFAIEALLRNTKEAGFNSIFNCFDDAFHDGILYQFDLMLRKKAIKKFKKVDIENIKMFYNLDNRLLQMPDFSYGNTQKLLSDNNLSKDRLCFEISERNSINNPASITSTINQYKLEGFNIAIDDFGTGISGLQLLYYSDTDFIKLDRFFINNIEKDSKKKLFCSSIIDMARIMNIKVIAEGLETKEEFYTCKDLGVDFVQGYLIQKPTTDVDELLPIYHDIRQLVKEDRRKSSNKIDKESIHYIEPISNKSNLHDLFVYFKENPTNTFVPVINEYNNLVGVIYEVDIKQISYSQYGMSLAKNSSVSSKLCAYIKPALCVDINWGVDKTLEIYNMSKESKKGIFVNKDEKYYGFIDVDNLLQLSYKRNLEIAKNQNPLTKLPGNKQIESYLEKIFENSVNPCSTIVYFDFNDFKPFNDYYGFRQGDRAILLFSELIQKEFSKNVFIAHVGGDDFFIGFNECDYEKIFNIVNQVEKEFAKSAQGLYKEEDIKRGYIKTKDRFGTSRKFSLLSVSSAIIEISKPISKEGFDDIIGVIKKSSKNSDIPVGASLIVTNL